MKFKFISKINVTPAMKKIKSDSFWSYGAKEWWRIYYDDVPHNTDALRRNVKIRPGEVEHIEHHAAFIYFGVKMIDPKYKVGGFTNDGGITWFSRRGVRKKQTNIMLKLKNGSRLWDKKAISEKKDLLLIKSMQKWINKNL